MLSYRYGSDPFLICCCEADGLRRGDEKFEEGVEMKLSEVIEGLLSSFSLWLNEESSSSLVSRETKISFLVGLFISGEDDDISESGIIGGNFL